MRSNSVYGSKVTASVDNMGVATKHAKVAVISKEFYDHGPEKRQR